MTHSLFPKASTSGNRVTLNFIKPLMVEIMKCKIRIKVTISRTQIESLSLCSTVLSQIPKWIKINSMSIKINQLISTTMLSQSLI